MQLQCGKLLAPYAAQCSPCKKVAMAQLGTGKRAGTNDGALVAGLTCEEGGQACAQATCGASVSFGAPPCSHHNISCQRGVTSLSTNTARHDDGSHHFLSMPIKAMPQRSHNRGQAGQWPLPPRSAWVYLAEWACAPECTIEADPVGPPPGRAGLAPGTPVPPATVTLCSHSSGRG